MKKLVPLACALALCLPMLLIACGGEDPGPDEPTASGPTAPPNERWYPEDDDGGGAPNGGGIFDPCSRAACWDWDRRKWVSDPPWEDDIVQPPVSPEEMRGQAGQQQLPQQNGGLPAQKPPVMNGQQQ